MPAAQPGTIIITTPGPDGTGPTVTLHNDPETGALAEPFAITVEGGTAHLDIRRADGVATTWSCVTGAHITPAMLAERAGITNTADLHSIIVTIATAT